MSAHVHILCATHGFLMAADPIHIEGSPCPIGLPPPEVEDRACQFPCPDKDYTDEELGLITDPVTGEVRADPNWGKL